MELLHRVLSLLKREALLLILLAALIPLLWITPQYARYLPDLVDWRTIGALTGLMVLSRGLEDSGYLAYLGRRLLTRIRNERILAVILILFSAALSSVITNDVTLFIVVPLTAGLRLAAELPVGRLAIFEAMAVNAGSAISPVGNPQNLFLWQTSGATFPEFILAMLPIGICMLLLLLLLVPFAFPSGRIIVAVADATPVFDKTLLLVSLGFYPLFLIVTAFGWAVCAGVVLALLYGVIYRQVLARVDWPLLMVFILMFVDLGLLARLPAVASLAGEMRSLRGGMLTAGALLSQFISNVPAAIFLKPFAHNWQALAWGVNVGGFGIAIGSLANLIALRLVRQPGLWREFHRWSLPVLVLGYGIAMVLLWMGL